MKKRISWYAIIDISPSTAGTRPQFATFGPGFVPFSVKSHKIQWGTAGGLSWPRVTRPHPSTSVAPESPCILCAVCGPDYSPCNRSARSRAQVRPLSVLLPVRNTIYFNIIVHVRFVIKCFYRLLNSITGIQTSMLLQSTANTPRGETQEVKE